MRPKQSLKILLGSLFGTMILATRGAARGTPGRRPQRPLSNHAKSTLACIRGGGYLDSPSGVIELNPNYIAPPQLPNRGGQQQPTNHQQHHHHHHQERYTLGDDDDDDDNNKHYIQTQDLSFAPSSQIILAPSMKNLPAQLQSMWQAFCNFHQDCPSIAQCMVACVVTFLSWQIPALQPTLAQWFVASRRNVFVGGGRWPSLILSAISHAGFFHLIFNLATLLSFGPMVQRTLQQYGRRVSSLSRFSSSSSSSSWPMWPLLLGSALAGSGTHLLMDQSAGGGGGGPGCMGLSSVTLGIVAVYTRLYPTTTLQIMLAGIIPVRLQAHTLLKFLLAWSVLGTLRASMLVMGKSAASTIAHSAHLGGLLFGLAYYEAWARRFHIDQMMRHIKAQFFSVQTATQ